MGKKPKMTYELKKEALCGLTNDTTIKNYTTHINQFSDWAKSEGYKTLDDIKNSPEGAVGVVQVYSKVQKIEKKARWGKTQKRTTEGFLYENPLRVQRRKKD